jgi:hypothetical protein
VPNSADDGATNSRFTGIEGDFTGADFRDMDLTDALFMRANLRGADFRNATVRGARFAEADLRFAKFTMSDISDVDFAKADVSDADFRLASGTNVDISGTDIGSTISDGMLIFDTAGNRHFFDESLPHGGLATVIESVSTEFFELLITPDRFKGLTAEEMTIRIAVEMEQKIAALNLPTRQKR